MAIAFDATANGNATAATLSFTHTTGAGLTNAIAFVAVFSRAATAGSISATWGGAAMTKIREDGPTSLMISTIFWLPLGSPAGGAVTVSITTTGAGFIIAGSVTLSGVSQSAIDAQAGATNTTSAISAVVTTVADGAWILDGAGIRTNTGQTITMTAHAGRTQRWNINTVANNGEADAGSTWGPISPPAATTVDWSQVGTQAWAMSAASFAPAAGGVAGPLPPPWLGTPQLDPLLVM